MIRIHKSYPPPNILLTDGLTQRDVLNTAYALNPASYTSVVGISNRTLKPLQFDSSIYGDATVREQLISDQHQKCCFCEAKFTDNGYGDVEHFRPKSAYQKANTNSLTYPGYYWLVYDWENLMFSCQKCNQKYKRNKFPLLAETTRKLFHNHPNSIYDEDHLLINPNSEDPADYFTFIQEVPVPINGSVKGATTIGIFELDRMNNTRLEYLLLLESALIWIEVDPRDKRQINLAQETFGLSRDKVMHYISEANRLYNSAAKDHAMFAYCVRCRFPNLPII